MTTCFALLSAESLDRELSAALQEYRDNEFIDLENFQKCAWLIAEYRTRYGRPQ
jgi:hypothetical protein